MVSCYDVSEWSATDHSKVEAKLNTKVFPWLIFERFYGLCGNFLRLGALRLDPEIYLHSISKSSSYSERFPNLEAKVSVYLFLNPSSAKRSLVCLCIPCVGKKVFIIVSSFSVQRYYNVYPLVLSSGSPFLPINPFHVRWSIPPYSMKFPCRTNDAVLTTSKFLVTTSKKDWLLISLVTSGTCSNRSATFFVQRSCKQTLSTGVY